MKSVDSVVSSYLKMIRNHTRVKLLGKFDIIPSKYIDLNKNHFTLITQQEIVPEMKCTIKRKRPRIHPCGTPQCINASFNQKVVGVKSKQIGESYFPITIMKKHRNNTKNTVLVVRCACDRIKRRSQIRKLFVSIITLIWGKRWFDGRYVMNFDDYIWLVEGGLWWEM